ncbi:NUDIX domain-containing protein [Litorilinea aerophila]|uniref:NUDIX domain-containing protein n=1 Tax=Litorilinea aerophila TaxID=1204385 RepID=UPI001B862665|nr:NUDIX domain-containing protein [Litorilinea aerophila]MCC9078470.1 NUDIX domain-containing protein [Litorilinea aerophila]GIV80057.1 MAG: hypothetical protein KatS3mg050_4451 [Litorilinea sp.]
MSIALGVNVAILHQGRLLLTRREDFEVWCLPGGAVDPNESIAQAAVREVWEETGLEVVLTRLVGLYSRPAWHDGHHNALFVARPIGGELRLCPGETIELAYFHPAQLPGDLLPWHRRQIADALAGYGGSVVVTEAGEWPFDPALSRQEIYALRDRSGLSRRAFLARHLERTAEIPPQVDVPGVVLPDGLLPEQE